MQCRPAAEAEAAAAAAAGAWETWCQRLLQSCLEAAPLDMAPAWASGIAFALRGLVECQHDASSQLLHTVTRPLAPGVGAQPLHVTGLVVLLHAESMQSVQRPRC